MSSASMDISSKLQQVSNQLASGKRIEKSSDDPVGYYQASMLKDKIAQQDVQSNAWSQIASRSREAESVIAGAVDTVNNLREWIVSVKSDNRWADSASLDKDMIAQLKDQLLSAANAKNAMGDFMFSGYQNVPPFSSTPGGVVYNGDQGHRQVPAGSEAINVEPTGDEVFFFKSESTVSASVSTNWYGGNNIGSGYVSVSSSASLSASYSVVFATDRSTSPVSTKMDILDAAGTSIVNGTNRITGTNQATTLPIGLSSGSTVDISAYLGQPANTTKLTLAGQPEDGDTFKLSNSTKSNIFDVVNSIAAAQNQPLVSTGSLTHNNLQASAITLQPSVGTQTWGPVLDDALNKIDAWLSNANAVRSSLGTTQSRAENSSAHVTELRDLYDAQRSNIEDLDYSAALMRQNQLNTQLQALYKTYSSSEGMSLFKYIA